MVSTPSPPHLKKLFGEMKKVCLQKNDNNSGASVVSSDTPVVIRGYPEVNHDSHEKEMPASVDELHCDYSDESDVNPEVSTLSSRSPQGGPLTQEVCIDSDGEEVPSLINKPLCESSEESDAATDSPPLSPAKPSEKLRNHDSFDDSESEPEAIPASNMELSRALACLHSSVKLNASITGCRTIGGFAPHMDADCQRGADVTFKQGWLVKSDHEHEQKAFRILISLLIG